MMCSVVFVFGVQCGVSFAEHRAQLNTALGAVMSDDPTVRSLVVWDWVILVDILQNYASQSIAQDIDEQ